MSLGQVALGFASIALGLNQIRSGAKRIRTAGGGELAALERVGVPRGRARGRGRLGRPLNRKGTGHEQTLAGPLRLRTYQINSLEDRIAHLQKIVQAGKLDPSVYAFTRRAVTQKCGDKWCVPEKNNAMEVKALFDAIRKNVRYTSDIAGADTYQTPGKTLKLRAGDCDDYATLVCAAAHQLGIPCRFAVIKTKGANDWNHIYAQVGLPRRRPTKWVSMDASVNMPCGWEAPRSMVAAKRVFPT